MNVFEANAAEIEKLRQTVDDTFRERNKSPEHMAAWQEAARAFHTAYDKLAFPGGLNRQFELLRAGDPTAIEMAVRFLEANPWYFRSGYHKADLLKILRNQSLTANQMCPYARRNSRTCTGPSCSRDAWVRSLRTKSQHPGVRISNSEYRRERKS